MFFFINLCFYNNYKKYGYSESKKHTIVLKIEYFEPTFFPSNYTLN